ncbi:MAG: nucleotide exchange factor GrpE [Sedimentisphaerales bacterium]|nr:nucleotide exchange factor GrpE [Sedimentisphaerales bacterium]
MTKKGKESEKDRSVKSLQAEVEDLRGLLDELRKENEGILGQLQRVSADYANFQKRVPKQVSDSVGYEKERVIKSLLPVLDNFEHTLLNAGSAENVDVLVKGIQIVYDQMLNVLRSHEVEQIAAAGEMFDPSRHEAIMQRSEPQEQENIVLEEFQKGYTLNGRVVRPSKVIVNKAVSQEQQTAGHGLAGDECDGDDTE